MRNLAFSPRSRQMDERTITRIQRDFYAGMFADIDKTIIPDNAVSYLKNVKNYGDRLEGRKGSRIWYDYDNNLNSNIPASGNINALYYSRYLDKLIILIDSTLYISTDATATSWNTIVNDSSATIANAESIFDEINNKVVLFNTNGVYKIYYDTHTSVWYCYRINAEIPDTKVTTNTTEDTYKYRYIYSLTRYSDKGYYNYNRQNSNVTLTQETGTNNEDSDYIDFSIAYTSGAISSGVPNILSGLIVPIASGTEREQQWNDFTIWRSKDIGINGYDSQTGIANDPEQFIWLDEVPVQQCFWVTCSGGTQYNVTPTSRNLQTKDISSTVYFLSGGSFVSGTVTNVGSTYFNLSTSSVVTSAPAFVGALSGGLITLSAGVISPVSGNTFSLSDIGRSILMYDGTRLHISGISGTSGLCYESTLNYETPSPVCWGISSTGRNYNDVVTDEELAPRVTAYPCFQRSYKPLPNCNIGISVPGFIFTTTRNDNYIYYSQVPYGYEHLVGCYNPFYQTLFVKDGISALKKMPDKLIIYCENSTTVVPLNVIDNKTIENLGIDVAIVTGQTELDNKIGVIAYNSIKIREDGTHILITNEPALRVFNGESYSPNLAYPYLTNVLNKLGFNIIADYNTIEGYTFWASDASISGAPNRCFNYGFGNKENLSSQGIGFSEIDGSYPIPYTNGIINIIDEYNYIRSLVLDKDDDVFYDITTRQCLTASDINVLTPSYSDKMMISGGSDLSGVDITPEITFKSDIAESQNYIIESDFHNFKTYRTYGTGNLGTTFTITINKSDKYDTDSCSQTIESTSNNKIPKIVFDQKIEGNELYTVISADQSNFTLTEREQNYIVKDINYFFTDQSDGENTPQENLGSPLLWWSIQGSTPLVDLVSGYSISGAVNLNGKAWCQEGATVHDGTYTIRGVDYSFYTSSGNYTFNLPSLSYSGNKSLFIMCASDERPHVRLNGGSEFSLAYQNELANFRYGTLVSGISGSGIISVELGPDIYAREFIDLRVYSGTLTSGDVDYLSNDIYTNFGDNTLLLQ